MLSAKRGASMIVRLANVVYWSCNAAAVLWVAAITFATINHSRPDWGVWFGTNAGVSRFDGEGFRSITPADGLSGSNVRAVLQDRKGAIWIASTGEIGRAHV